MKLHEYLTKLRNEHGDTKEGMAEKLMVKPTTLKVVESHSRPFPQPWYARLRRAYGMTDKDVRALETCVHDGLLLEEIAWDNMETYGDGNGYTTYLLIMGDKDLAVTRNDRSGMCSMTMKDGDSLYHQTYGYTEEDAIKEANRLLGVYGMALPMGRHT